MVCMHIQQVVRAGQGRAGTGRTGLITFLALGGDALLLPLWDTQHILHSFIQAGPWSGYAGAPPLIPQVVVVIVLQCLCTNIQALGSIKYFVRLFPMHLLVGSSCPTYASQRIKL